MLFHRVLHSTWPFTWIWEGANTSHLTIAMGTTPRTGSHFQQRNSSPNWAKMGNAFQHSKHMVYCERGILSPLMQGHLFPVASKVMDPTKSLILVAHRIASCKVLPATDGIQSRDISSDFEMASKLTQFLTGQCIFLVVPKCYSTVLSEITPVAVSVDLAGACQNQEQKHWTTNWTPLNWTFCTAASTWQHVETIIDYTCKFRKTHR